MRDPTRDEMFIFLKSHMCSEDEGTALDAEVAMYWFAMYWHHGQDSNLYSVLSTSPYSPGPVRRLEDEGVFTRMMFDALEEEYGDPARGGALT